MRPIDLLLVLPAFRASIAAAGILAIASALPLSSAAPVRIGNRWLQVAFDPEKETYEIKDSSGRTVFREAGIAQSGNAASMGDVTDPVFGPGRRIKSGLASISIYDSLPFALIQSSLAQPLGAPGGAIPARTIALTAGVVDPDQPLSNLRIIGTGGLMYPIEGPDETSSAAPGEQPRVVDSAANTDQSFRDQPRSKPGSYAWAAVGNPDTRRGLVMAWLTHDKAAGLVFASVSGSNLQLEARAEYGRYACGTAVPTEILAIGCFDDVRLGLEAWADAVAKVYSIHLPPQISGYSTNSVVDGHGIAGFESETAEVAKFAARELKPFGLKYLQIDDGWQVAKRDFATHNPTGPYPGGMKLTADRIHEAGLVPGLWTVPFVGNGEDTSILAKFPDGKPFEARWSGYCLDLSRPKAVESVQTVTRRLTCDWGYGFLKLDGFHAGTATDNVYINTGYRDSTIGQVLLSDPRKTQIEVFRQGARMLRETVGPNVFLLGCAVTQNMVSYAGSFGLVDAMRVGPDNAAKWGRWASNSPIFGTLHYFENRRIWYVDPDMAYVRDSLTLDQARTSASWTAVSGQLFTASDWLPGLSAERLDILKRTMEPHHGVARPVDFFEKPASSIWLLSDREPQPNRQIVAIYNITPGQRTIGDSLRHIGLDPTKEYVAFDFWGNRLAGRFKDRIEATLAPSQCQILSVLPMPDHPRLISTSRHVTQGMVDCIDEKWDAAGRTITCRNRLVAGDPCEMRIVLPEPSENWCHGTVRLQSADLAAGATVGAIRREDNLLRFTITSRQDREVAWNLDF